MDMLRRNSSCMSSTTYALMDLPVWQKKRLTEHIKLNYRKANLDKIKNILSSSDWDRLLEGNIETAWNNFKNLILSLVDANVPKKEGFGY